MTWHTLLNVRLGVQLGVSPTVDGQGRPMAICWLMTLDGRLLWLSIRPIEESSADHYR